MDVATDANGQFDLQAQFDPMGDQPNAIRELVDGLDRGDEHQTLLGATGTGKSLGYDDPVYVTRHDDGSSQTRVDSIGAFVDRCIADHGVSVRYGNGTEETVLPDGAATTLAIDPGTGSVGEQPVRAVTRHAAPDTMYRVRTACGREATLTGDHNLWVLREGALQLIETSDARPTDHLPIPTRLDDSVRRSICCSRWPTRISTSRRLPFFGPIWRRRGRRRWPPPSDEPDLRSPMPKWLRCGAERTVTAG